MSVDPSLSEPHPDDVVRFGEERAARIAIYRANARKQLRSLRASGARAGISDAVIRYCFRQAFFGSTAPPLPESQLDAIVLQATPSLVEFDPSEMFGDGLEGAALASAVVYVLDGICDDEFPAKET